MKSMRHAVYLAAASALAIAAPASAQRVDRIVAFGDSYVDDGNAFQLAGITPPAAYPNGRFSNGTNFVDTMGQILNVPIQNFGIGGAQAGNGNVNPGLPGFATEWQSFLAGGGPAAFPRTDGRFAPNDLLVVSIGGNDARAYRIGGGTVAGAPAAAAVSVTQATTGLNALVGAGARNITFLAGDVGRLPEAIGQPSAPAGTAFSGAFNQGIRTTLAGYANQGVIVNYLDLNLVGDRVQANLAAFGLQSAGASTSADVAAGRADNFLFYADNVHLSSAGFAIVGRYAVRQLEAPLHLQAQADIGLLTATSFGNTLSGRLDLSNSRFGAGSERGFNLFASGNTSSLGRDAAPASLGYDMNTFGGTLGAEYDTGAGAVFGAAVNYTRGEADMDTATGRAKTKAWQVGLYGGWASGGLFIQGQASYGWLDYEIDRDAVIDSIAADPGGTAITAGAQAGYLFGVGGMRVGPVVGLRYAKAEIDAYTETGDPALTLDVGDQELQSLIGSAGIEARGELDVGGLAVRPYAAATLEREFDGDGRTVLYALTAAPEIVNRWVIPERSDDIYGRIAAGVNLSLGDAASLQLQGSTSIAQDEGNDLYGFLALRLSL
ncbi:autotransporter domain-containing protein [Sphingosinicella sp. LHD-64]|uniref:autotransporter domain-containing protein n=1 Tax=Sphingosinicella sp. LHD-64 TaxID=3072139 RepID=UPI00280DB920|nr:autotransporter domain-containing protein [Sphingosinicella sp. LHD-64]MDQ8757341.1 autotransporter domain-containing protein [Sphingosinicella sp. LHD-64]